MPRALAELAAFGAVVAVATARFWNQLVAAGHPSDEVHYFVGFARYAAGLDPYAVRDVVFTPFFAWLGSGLVTVAGEPGAALALRAASLVAIAATAWLAAAATGRPLGFRLGLALAAVLLFPPFANGVFFGNIGLLATGLLLGALALVPGRPRLAGLLLGLSLAIKPLAVALLPLLLFRGRASPGRRLSAETLAAATAVLTAGALVLAAGPALLPRFLARHTEAWPDRFLLGFVQAAAQVGIALPTWAPLVLVTAVAALWFRRREISDPLFGAGAPALALAGSPIVWSHTLALSLPIQMRALAGAGALRHGPSRRVELPFRLALAATTWGAGAAGAIDTWPGPVRAAVSALPLVAAVVLVARSAGDEAPVRPSPGHPPSGPTAP